MKRINSFHNLEGKDYLERCYYLEILHVDTYVADFIMFFLDHELLIVERRYPIARTTIINGEEMYESSDKLPVLYIRQCDYCYDGKKKINTTRWYITKHVRDYYQYLTDNHHEFRTLFCTNDCYLPPVKERHRPAYSIPSEVNKCAEIVEEIFISIKSKAFLPEDAQSLKCIVDFEEMWQKSDVERMKEEDKGKSKVRDDERKKREYEKHRRREYIKIMWSPTKWTKDVDAVNILSDAEQLLEGVEKMNE